MGAAVIHDFQSKIVGACVQQCQVGGPLEGEAFAAQIGLKRLSNVALRVL